MGQEQVHHSGTEDEPQGETSDHTRRTAGGAAVAGVRDRETRDSDIDAILDEIDEVLEENAEEVVSAYVQRGGQ